jgi:hypothetical protein
MKVEYYNHWNSLGCSEMEFTVNILANGVYIEAVGPDGRYPWSDKTTSLELCLTFMFLNPWFLVFGASGKVSCLHLLI